MGNPRPSVSQLTGSEHLILYSVLAHTDSRQGLNLLPAAEFQKWVSVSLFFPASMPLHYYISWFAKPRIRERYSQTSTLDSQSTEKKPAYPLPLFKAEQAVRSVQIATPSPPPQISSLSLHLLLPIPTPTLYFPSHLEHP